MFDEGMLDDDPEDQPKEPNDQGGKDVGVCPWVCLPPVDQANDKKRD